MTTLRYLMFGSPDWDRRQHLVGEDNQPICGARRVEQEEIDSRRALIMDEPYERRTICQQCTRQKASYLDRLKLAEWRAGKKR